MANQEQVIMLCKRRGVEQWNEWRIQNPNTEIDLSNAQLQDVNLKNVDLANANLAKRES